MKLTRRKIALTIAVLIAGLIAVQAIWRPFGGRLEIQPHAVAFDIHYPDAMIDSVALSHLPRDIVRVPLLQTLLTQDFVDYYESNSTRLSAEGALRRLAFEHDLEWRDELIKRVLDEPSRVLLWRSPDGRLGYWVMTMRRNGLLKLMQAMGNVAASDSQLSKVATLSGDVPVYALKLAVGHTLLFAAKGEQFIAMSEPGILLDENGKTIGERAKALAQMLDDGGADAMRAWHLDAVPANGNGHRLIVSVNYLSFGYQGFFPGIDAVRFDFSASGNGKWNTAALIDPGRLPQHWDSAELWRALPSNAAACASVPVDWSDAADMLGELRNGEQAAANVLREQFTGPAAVCWYAKSTLVAPVFVARLKPEVARDPARLAQIRSALADVFPDAIGAYEARANDAAGYRRLPVQTREAPGGATLWMRPVSARSGTAQSAGSPYAAQLSSPRYFPVTLALAHGYVVFSPDARLVDDTLAVLDKRYPAIADTLSPQRLSTSVVSLTPATAAALVEREAGRTLPADQEAIFRNAARAHLLPKLHAVASYAPVSLSLPDSLPSSAGWVPVEWHVEPRASVGPRDDNAAGRPLGTTGAADSGAAVPGADDQSARPGTSGN
ncbi:DUF2138 domain-containing protein [Paraburkholderia lycopersici]|uniref:Uncharacterized conserved protein YfaA, DUF2138 family n=1 Tax=Paraburkholderia lycopersici TaxID=416944 RepID=A0A1G6ZQP4_9BURK|nr:DUF2138 domain-containing protein [Paraburkholderia lycopersici]SDE04870.1 Uncharacterized conserved protein YfaA, DUF2138 family [Paraburkholderia lycopersici]